MGSWQPSSVWWLALWNMLLLTSTPSACTLWTYMQQNRWDWKKINAIQTHFIITCSRWFIYISSFNFHKSYMSLVPLLSSLYKETEAQRGLETKNPWGPERARAQTQAVWPGLVDGADVSLSLHVHGPPSESGSWGRPGKDDLRQLRVLFLVQAGASPDTPSSHSWVSTSAQSKGPALSSVQPQERFLQNSVPV